MYTGVVRKFILALTLTGVIATLSHAQDVPIQAGENGNEAYKIEWVSQFPAARIQKESRSGKRKLINILLGSSTKPAKSHRENWFTNFIFGKKPSSLIKPMSILALNPDTIWVADQGHGSILNIYNRVGYITQFKSKLFETLPSIVGACLLPGNKILFTDSKLNKIFQMTPGEKDLHIFNNTQELLQPTGIAYSSVTKEVWVVETKEHRISVLDEKGNTIRQIGKRGIGPGEFNFPTFIWIDNSGTIYVVDAMNFRIQIFNKSGDFISMFGEPGDASGYLSRPKGLATDSFGHIYVADALFHVVQVFDNTGKLLYILGSQGQGKGQFWMPTGIFIDDNNYIYVADSYNSRVQVFRLVPQYPPQPPP